MHKIQRIFIWTISSSLCLMPLSGFCRGQEKRPLANNVTAQETKAEFELSQQVGACMQRGEVRQVVGLLKRARQSLDITIHSSDPDVRGIRDASDVSKVVMSFEKGDEVRVVNYSGEGKDQRGLLIPAGKFLYVSHLKRKGSDEWTEVMGVVFAKSVSRVSAGGAFKEDLNLLTPIQFTYPIEIQSVTSPKFSKEHLERVRAWIDF